MYDVIIAGAGVTGLSTGYHLAKSGERVLVIDKNAAGKGASFAAAGMLGAQTELHQSAEMFQFAVKCRNYFQTFTEELEEISNQNIYYRREGAWKFARSKQEKKELEQLIHRQQQAGEEVTDFTGTDLQEKLPGLNTENVDAAFFPAEAQVDARSYTAALIEAVRQQGDLVENAEITKIEQKDVGWKVTAGEQIYYGKKLLLAAGTAKLMNLEVPGVVPVKGECVAVKPDVLPFTSTIFTPDVYLVPKGDGRLIIGATETEGDCSTTVTAGAVSYLLQEAIRIVPALADAPIHEVWAGVRPKSIDGYPFAGKVKEGLYVSSGYYRNGILMSGLSGRLLSEEMLQETKNKELQLLDPQRRHS
ncbi:glycine oxidase ThiO [Alkalicoccus daliensis]|uniref:glycine oxidase n=1 Tax=Alkalicoccus daliensis TaxID=745820 RepID=A0A1H0DZD2_9BACI|nr:glycine oxidase ThiO [Alkalicoccus daliensis]SDN75479.1 glycine oxidase [Alkalicoccus daliensis]